MPQRENVTLIPLTVATIEESIRRAWEDKKYRPTSVLIGSRHVAKGIFEIPFVNYDNASGGTFMPLQRIITKNQSVHRSAWQGLGDAFDMKFSPGMKPPQGKCFLAYDHMSEEGRAPEGFTVGKRYYFVEMDLDGVELTLKDPDKQLDANPVRAISMVSGLGQIRASLSSLREGKRWALCDAITNALHRRLAEYQTKQQQAA